MCGWTLAIKKKTEKEWRAIAFDDFWNIEKNKSKALTCETHATQNSTK